MHLHRLAALLALSLFATLVRGGGGPEAVAASAVGVPLMNHVRLGAYVEGMVADPTRLTGYETLLGRKATIASYFYGLGDEFPAAIEKGFSDGGRRDVLLSWDMGATRFTDWSSGKFDKYLHTIATHAKAYPYRVYVRPWPEMNGDWQDFQPTAAGTKPYGGTPTQFVAAWRHIVTTIRRAGVANLKWVFNPTADTYAETTNVQDIWPGAAYVDVLGLDGYNWGNGGHFRWRSFEEVFRTQYTRLTRLHARAPVWICEYGSKEPTVDDGAPVDSNHDKGAWTRSMLASTQFPRITTLVAFSANKERDWRLNSSAASLSAWRKETL